jgi:3-oxoacyl-[acyl-carrier protein] reductase
LGIVFLIEDPITSKEYNQEHSRKSDDMIDPKLEGKTAIITGANHGIGAATAKALAAQGAQVFITYYRPAVPYSDAELEVARQDQDPGMPLYYAHWQQTGEAIADEIVSSGGAAVAREVDLAQAENIRRLFDWCDQELGHADILVINHTHWSPDTFDPALASAEKDAPVLVDVETIDRHLSVNARASALLIREFTKRHLARQSESGRIVTLTTVAAHSASISYAASKRAVVSYSLSAAQELGKYGITVNVVCPGATQTGYITPEQAEKITQQTPLGRVGYPEDVADVIMFLVSEQGRWLTGNLIYASGGFLMFMNE